MHVSLKITHSFKAKTAKADLPWCRHGFCILFWQSQLGGLVVNPVRTNLIFFCLNDIGGMNFLGREAIVHDKRCG